jgi:hypothetical protein
MSHELISIDSNRKKLQRFFGTAVKRERKRERGK